MKIVLQLLCWQGLLRWVLNVDTLVMQGINVGDEDLKEIDVRVFLSLFQS